MKYTRVPSELIHAPYYHRALKIKGFSAVESCTTSESSQGAMLLEEHLLLYVRQGQNLMTHGKASYLVKKHEMLLLKKHKISYNNCCK